MLLCSFLQLFIFLTNSSPRVIQNFTYMDNEFVEDFQSLFKEALEKHVKNQQDRSIKTFLASSGYQEEISAQDAVWALDTMLKSYLHTSQSTTNVHSQQFFTAFNCLEGQGQQGGQSIVKLTPGFNLAKLTLKAIISNVRNILTSRQIQQVGAVLYFSFSLTNPDLDRIAPVLTLFTLILRDAFIKSLPSKRRLIAWDLQRHIVKSVNQWFSHRSNCFLYILDTF